MLTWAGSSGLRAQSFNINSRLQTFPKDLKVLSLNMGLIIKNIKCIVQNEDHPRLRICGKEMAKLNVISNAFLLLSEVRILGNI